MSNARPGLAALAAIAAVAAGASAAHAQLVWVGPEIPVNAVASGSQFAPAIVTDAAGGFVAAWQSAEVDGSGFGIRARRFEADGSPATVEIAVNTFTAGDQVSPAVSLLEDGAFVVVWASNGADGDGFGIRARRFSETGAPLSAELAVNSTTAGSQVAPKVVPYIPGSLSTGFLAIWTGTGLAGDTNDIFARGFDANGAPLSAEFRVNSTVSGQQVTPAIAYSFDNSYMAAWASEGQDGSGYAVVARRFTATGTFLTAEIAVPEITTLDQLAPAVAEFGGSFTVVWQRSLQATPLPVGPQPILAFRRFAANGVPIGDEVAMHLDTAVRHERPNAIFDGSGRLVVAWKETDPISGRTDAAAARWDPDGFPLGGDFTINTTLDGDQIDPVLAPGAGARFVAAWSSFGQDGSSFGVFAQRFGEPLGPCVEDAETLCLNDGRFRVRASFWTSHPSSGDAQAVALTDDSGYFTFFDPANVEIVIKVLDACGLAGFENFWVFATGLTNVGVTMTVEDTATGDFRVYTNDLNEDYQPILDTSHFEVCGAGLAASASARVPSAFDSARTEAVASAIATDRAATAMDRAVTGGCVPDADSLCLRDGRFEVTIDWTTAQGGAGAGQAVALTDESGYFWFFDAANVELVIKVIDGCSSNDRFWIFAGGLTNVGTRLRVRDTAHPEAPVFERIKPIGTPFAPILTIEGFDTCP